MSHKHVELVRYGYGDAGHEYAPDRYGRCRWASGGYCDGTAKDTMHDRRVIASQVEETPELPPANPALIGRR
jgi:hypothetical protein